MTKCIFQSGVENMNANVQESLDFVSAPSHLLLLYHALGNDLVDGRFNKARRDSQLVAVAISVIRHRISVRFQIANQIQECVGHSFKWESILGALGTQAMLEVNKARDATLCISVPEPPFGVFEFVEYMGTDYSIVSLIYAFGKLFEILKLHADVKPVQDMLSLRDQLAMNGPQASVAIG